MKGRSNAEFGMRNAEYFSFVILNLEGKKRRVGVPRKIANFVGGVAAKDLILVGAIATVHPLVSEANGQRRLDCDEQQRGGMVDFLLYPQRRVSGI